MAIVRADRKPGTEHTSDIDRLIAAYSAVRVLARRLLARPTDVFDEVLAQDKPADAALSLSLGLRHDLSGIDLRTRDLQSFYLYGKRLRHANLAGADLSYANLSHADLRGADLTDTALFSANLSGADLRGARMLGTDLANAYLCGADLRGARDFFPVAPQAANADARTRWPDDSPRPESRGCPAP
jgi:uncharacterized protein YjbI with pentapeptide repeats